MLVAYYGVISVSYTHLDVYKRQVHKIAANFYKTVDSLKSKYCFERIMQIRLPNFNKQTLFILTEGVERKTSGIASTISLPITLQLGHSQSHTLQIGNSYYYHPI